MALEAQLHGLGALQEYLALEAAVEWSGSVAERCVSLKQLGALQERHVALEAAAAASESVAGASRGPGSSVRERCRSDAGASGGTGSSSCMVWERCGSVACP